MAGGCITRHVDVGVVTLALDEWSAGSGRPVLFLHATGFSRGVWRPMAAALVDRCRPLALDLRGHGGSSAPPPPYEWSRMAEDVLAVAERERWSDLVIVGHSLGGGTGILAAIERPELVSALVLVEAPLRPSREGGPSDMVERALRRRSEWPSREETAAHLRSRAPYDSWHPDVFAGFVETGFRARDGTGGTVELACAREIEAAVFTGSPLGQLWADLPRLRCPVWIGRGTGDRGLGSTTAPDAAQRLRDAHEWVAEGDGHFVPLERPGWVEAMVREALDILDGNPPQAWQDR